MIRFLERISRFFADGHFRASGDVRRDGRWRIDHGGETFVGGRIPEVLHEFGPSLMQVRRTAGVARQQAEKVVATVMVVHEIPFVARADDLVGLLEILAGHEIVGDLGRQGIECHLFQMIGVGAVPRDLENFFEGEHQFHDRA